MFKSAILCIALLLTACTNTVSRDFTTGTKKIAILSFAGQNFHSLENVRPTSAALVKRWMELKAELPLRDYYGDLFDKTETRSWKHDISSWEMDSFYVATATKNLAPAYTIVPFAQKPMDIDFDGSKGLFPFEGERFADKVAQIVREQPGFTEAGKVDAYIVILPGEWLLMGRERISSGLGFFRTFFDLNIKAPQGEGTYVLHAFYYVMVLDGKTLKMMAGDAARDEDDRQGLLKGHPGAYVGPEYWAPSFDALKPDQQQLISAALKTYIDNKMPSTLRKLGLIP